MRNVGFLVRKKWKRSQMSDWLKLSPLMCVFRREQCGRLMDDAKWHPPNTGGTPDPSAHLHSPQREQTSRTHARPRLRAGIREWLRAQVQSFPFYTACLKWPASICCWSEPLLPPALRCRCRGSASRRWRRWAGRTGQAWTTSSRGAIKAFGRLCKELNILNIRSGLKNIPVKVVFTV